MDIGRRSLHRLGPAALTALAAAAVPPARAEEAGSAWGRIRGSGVLRLGVTPSEPWYAKDPVSGTWDGFGVRLGKQMADDMGGKLQTVETTWANAPAGLQANQFDVMFVLDPTPQRALAIDFPFAPVLYYALGVMVPDGMTVKDWSDLDKPNLTIAVPIGTSMEREITALLKRATIHRLATIDQTVLDYQSGRAQVLALFHPALTAYRAKIGKGQVVIPHPVISAVAGAGVRREPDKTWRDYLTTVLTYYYNNGTTERLYRGYLADRGLNPASVPGITRESWGQG